MSDVKIIRLVSGEDVIAKITDYNNMELDKPFVIIPTQKAPGQPVQLMMTPYSPYSKTEKVMIRDDKIVSMVDPKEEILASYQSNTSRILTPKSDLITETNIPTLKKW